MNPLFTLIPVFLPIVGGIMMLWLKIKDRFTRNLVSELIVCLTSVCVWIALFCVDDTMVSIYDFMRGFSISFIVDGLGSVFAFMVSVMWPLVMLYAFDYMKHEERQNTFFAFYVMTYGITLGVAFAANMTTLYVFFEMLTLVTIPLVMHYQDGDSIYAVRKYAIYTIGGASLAFFTVVVTNLYGGDGFFHFSGNIYGGFSPAILQVAFIFGFFGFGVKAAVFPLHGWLPTASVAPTPVTALLHAVAVVNSGVFAVIRLTWYMYGASILEGTWVQYFCMMFAVFTLIYAAVMAVKERHFKRRMAYSTVSNLSYMLFGVMLLTPTGLEAGIAHMVFHGIVKIVLFMCAGAFMHATGNQYIYEINGVGKKMPVTFVCYTLGALSLTGVPMFCGFISKWKLLNAGLKEGSVFGLTGIICLIISAFLCAIYTLTVSLRAFFSQPDKDLYPEESGAVREADIMMLIPIVVFTAANVAIGIYSTPVMDYIERIVRGWI